MTVSIGVVTNERRHFTHAAQVSELATEMKSYAKTLPGSVYSIDRRTDSQPGGVTRISGSPKTQCGRETSRERLLSGVPLGLSSRSGEDRRRATRARALLGLRWRDHHRAARRARATSSRRRRSVARPVGAAGAPATADADAGRAVAPAPPPRRREPAASAHRHRRCSAQPTPAPAPAAPPPPPAPPTPTPSVAGAASDAAAPVAPAPPRRLRHRTPHRRRRLRSTAAPPSAARHRHRRGRAVRAPARSPLRARPAGASAGGRLRAPRRGRPAAPAGGAPFAPFAVRPTGAASPPPSPPRPPIGGPPPRPFTPPAAAPLPSGVAASARPTPAPARRHRLRATALRVRRPPPVAPAPRRRHAAPARQRLAHRRRLAPPINPFLANDPNAKAKRLARALVSDIVAYFPAEAGGGPARRHAEAALPRGDQEELRGVRRAGRARVRREHDALPGRAERRARRRKEALLVAHASPLSFRRRERHRASRPPCAGRLVSYSGDEHGGKRARQAAVLVRRSARRAEEVSLTSITSGRS